MKQKLTISVDREVLLRAKHAGINISEATEMLLEAITLSTEDKAYKDIIKAFKAYQVAAQNLSKILGGNRNRKTS